MNPKTTYRIALVLLAVSFLLGLEHLANAGGLAFYADSDNYREAASDLYHFGKAHPYRTLLFSAVSGLPYLFSAGDGAVFTFSKIVNVLCWLGTIQLLFGLLADRILQKRAFFATLIFVFCLGPALVTQHLLTESFFAFWAMLAFWMLGKFYSQNEAKWLFAGVSFFLLLGLVRPGAFWFGLLISAFLIGPMWRNRSWKALPVLFSISAILLQMTMMKLQFGNFTLSYIDAPTYYNYLGNRAESIAKGSEFSTIGPRRDRIFALSFPESKKEAARDFTNQIRHNPSGLALAFIADFRENSVSGSAIADDCRKSARETWRKNTCAVLYESSQWQNVLLTLVGIFASVFWVFNRRKWKLGLPLAGFTMYTMATSAVSCTQGDRFHIVLFPIMVLMAFAAIGEIVKQYAAPLRTSSRYRI